jgi:hypothetical protein
MLQDVVLLRKNPADLRAKYAGVLAPAQQQELEAGLRELWRNIVRQGVKGQLDITRVQAPFIQRFYSNVLDHNDNAGHRFGDQLSDAEKRALIAFLATL